MTEGVFVTVLYGNGGELGLANCVGYDKLGCSDPESGRSARGVGELKISRRLNSINILRIAAASGG